MSGMSEKQMSLLFAALNLGVDAPFNAESNNPRHNPDMSAANVHYRLDQEWVRGSPSYCLRALQYLNEGTRNNATILNNCAQKMDEALDTASSAAGYADAKDFVEDTLIEHVEDFAACVVNAKRLKTALKKIKNLVVLWTHVQLLEKKQEKGGMMTLVGDVEAWTARLKAALEEAQ